MKAVKQNGGFCAPILGRWRPDASSVVVKAGERIGRIVCAGEAIVIVAPESGAFELVSRGIVQFGQPLASRLALGGVEEADDAEVATDAVFAAPMSGRFYSRPSPDEPQFVTAGESISTGKTIGMLEVMKTFNRIKYDGPPRTIKRIVPDDGDDVSRGGALLEFES